MTKNLEQVVTMILNSFKDDHPRVRWAAINAIGQLSTDLGPDLQVQHHHVVLPALVGAMDDFQNPRVQVCTSTCQCQIHGLIIRNLVCLASLFFQKYIGHIESLQGLI